MFRPRRHQTVTGGRGELGTAPAMAEVGYGTRGEQDTSTTFATFELPAAQLHRRATIPYPSPAGYRGRKRTLPHSTRTPRRRTLIPDSPNQLACEVIAAPRRRIPGIQAGYARNIVREWGFRGASSIRPVGICVTSRRTAYAGCLDVSFNASRRKRPGLCRTRDC